MIGYFINNQYIADSNGNVLEPKDMGLLVLDYLFNSYKDDIRVFYDMDACVSSLLHIIGLTESEAVKLKKYEKVNIPPYKITYFPQKFFGLDCGKWTGHPYVNFYDAEQYMENPEPLVNVTYEKALELARMAAHAVEKASERIVELGGDGTKISSPVSAFQNEYANLKLPKLYNIPIQALEMAFDTLHGSWLECYKYGHFDNVYDYDANSSYAADLRNLIDLRCGHWEISDSIPDKAYYGFAEGEIETQSQFHPFIERSGEDTLGSYSVTGKWQRNMTVQEIKHLYNYRLGTYKIKNGMWWVLDRQPIYPFADMVDSLYNQRANSDDWLTRKLLHRRMAGTWGKLLELRQGKFGEFYNSVYGCIVETNTRLRLSKTCLDNNIMPVSVAVDGFVSEKPIKETSTEIGKFRLAACGKCISLNSTTVAIEGKNSNAQFAVKYDWLIDSINRQPFKDCYTLKGYSPVTLGEALQYNKLDKLGEMELIKRSVYVEPDNNRMWHNRATNGYELLRTRETSTAYDVNVIKNLEHITEVI